MAYFPSVKKKIKYEGPESDNPLAFKYFNPRKKVRGKTMQQHLKFAVAYWHTFKGTGADPFGGGVYNRPWDQASDPMSVAEMTLEAAFEFFTQSTSSGTISWNLTSLEGMTLGLQFQLSAFDTLFDSSVTVFSLRITCRRTSCRRSFLSTIRTKKRSFLFLSENSKEISTL